MSFIPKRHWDNRGTESKRIDVINGKPEAHIKSWGYDVKKRYKGKWKKTHRKVIEKRSPEKVVGEEFDLSDKQRMIWKNVDNLSVLETKEGELKHLCEWGASLGTIKLDECPASGVWKYELEFPKNSRLFYQPALTQKEIDEGHERPPAVVGSYEVFGKYGEKFAHILRPRIKGKKGKTFWGELHIDKPTIENDTAIYPIEIRFDLDELSQLSYPAKINGNLTIGYTSIGGSSYRPSARLMTIFAFSGAAGTATSMSWYGYEAAGTDGTLGVYNIDGGALKGDTVGGTLPTSADWETRDFDSSWSILASEVYLLALHTDGAFRSYYTASNYMIMSVSTQTYTSGTLIDPNPGYSRAGHFKVSCYVTYTEAAAGGETSHVF